MWDFNCSILRVNYFVHLSIFIDVNLVISHRIPAQKRFSNLQHRIFRNYYIYWNLFCITWHWKVNFEISYIDHFSCPFWCCKKSSDLTSKSSTSWDTILFNNYIYLIEFKNKIVRKHNYKDLIGVWINVKIAFVCILTYLVLTKGYSKHQTHNTALTLGTSNGEFTPNVAFLGVRFGKWHGAVRNGCQMCRTVRGICHGLKSKNFIFSPWSQSLFKASVETRLRYPCTYMTLTAVISCIAWHTVT